MYLEYVILVFLGLGMTLVTFGNAVGRYVFNYTAPWAEEATRIMFVWSMFVAITSGFIRNKHIGFSELAKKNAVTMFIGDLVYNVTLMVVGGVLAIYGWDYMIMTGGVPLAGTDLPTALFLLPGVIAGGIWAVTGFIRLVIQFVSPMKTETEEQ